ncbi:phospholipase D-like domain-containing protein [Chitinimonas sp. BJB300]|uniref:phospholipase D-like domain-containing protein n=1 Tax=Chitinimonas sp. BJB300 TaxID=1559339 RepID=UPI000C0DE640|nr:phospholipase D-like domain-containing protein [Chitinimonas sp. BJB300]PHV09800.1 hypothetical protein CSQ89_19685 [Chitinimonas sp. BJB300]
MRSAGIRVLEYDPLNPLWTRNKWLVNNRDHRKLLVVDGKVAFLCGVNISKVYSRGSHLFKRQQSKDGQIPWRDTHLQIEGPVVADFQRCFLSTWQRQNGPPLAEQRYFPSLSRQGKDLVRAIPSAFNEAYSQVYVALISAISHAEKQIYLTNAYFVPDEQFPQALIDAAKRGVEVQLVGHIGCRESSFYTPAWQDLLRSKFPPFLPYKSTH